MRQGKLVLSCVAMLSGGLACLALAPAPALLPGIKLTPELAVILTSLACGAALVGLVRSGALPRQQIEPALRRLRESGKLEPIDSAECENPEVRSAINQLIEHSRDRIAAAELRSRELDLQLRIATSERQHAEAIIYSISDGVLVTDRFDELVMVNEAACRALKLQLPATGRAPVAQVLPDPEIVGLIREMRQSESANTRRVIEHTVAAVEGERVYRVTVSTVASKGEKPSGVVAVLHDITREKEVAQMKNQFVSSVSHELRTPLASIKAYAEMLIDGEAEEEKTRDEFYEVIQTEANRLSRLIDNILNISRIESGLVRTDKKPLSPIVVLKQAMDVIVPQARQKQITVEEQLSPAFYQTVADRDMLYEAILNLLSNAIKYTPEGGRITVSSRIDEARRKVEVRISDTGVGIPPKDLPYIFDKFYRSESNCRMAKGTGLGLSLVKHIIETVHKGRMFVESHVGQGSTFGFELDLVD